MMLIFLILNFVTGSKNIYVIENSVNLLTGNQSKLAIPRFLVRQRTDRRSTVGPQAEVVSFRSRHSPDTA